MNSECIYLLYVLFIIFIILFINYIIYNIIKGINISWFVIEIIIKDDWLVNTFYGDWEK